MVQGRAAGNGNFDIDAIRMAANAMENAPTVTDQPFIDPVAEAIANDLDDMIDQLIANPLSHVGDELTRSMEMILASPLASKLGAGFIAQVQNSLNIQEERIANGSAAFTRGDGVWEEQKEKREKDRAEQAKIADMADDANNGQLSTKPDQFGNSQQDYADLSNELKSRDGQERYMAFLRLLHPNMTDAQIRERMEKTAAIAAREANQPLTERQQGLLENMPPAEEAELKGEVDQYNEMNAGRFTPTVANRADAQVVDLASNDASAEIALGTRSDLLVGGNDSGAIAPSRTSLTSQVEGQGEFAATAPSLRASFVAANAATGAPLDQPTPQIVASAAPVPAVNAGFDV